MINNIDGMYRMRDAIVKLAVEDYKVGLREKLKYRGGGRWENIIRGMSKAESEMRRNFITAKQFFESSYFVELTDMDGREIMRRIREDVYMER